MPKPTTSLIAACIAAISINAASIARAGGEPKAGDGLIHVDPVRSADEAREVLEREGGEASRPKLMIGQKAPKLEIAKWVKGDSVTDFEKGRTYVVEFWATWCGPCVASMPHVSELQKKYADGVTFIGVNIWDREQDRNTREYVESMEDQIERVSNFVKEKGDTMAYTVAIEESGKMAEHWMMAAGQGGIPTAFIVDKAGKIAWIGHPMTLEKPLEQILKGEWDYKAAADEQLQAFESSYWRRHLMELLTNESTAERGYKVAYALLRTPLADDPNLLNSVAWTVLTSSRIPVRDLDLAMTYAKVACEKTDWKNPSVLDTLARAYYDKGDREKAIEMETKAVEFAEGTSMQDSLKETLEHYKKGD